MNFPISTKQGALYKQILTFLFVAITCSLHAQLDNPAWGDNTNDRNDLLSKVKSHDDVIFTVNDQELTREASKIYPTSALFSMMADPDICYVASDQGDQLNTLRRDGTQIAQNIGSNGVTAIEAITMSLDGNTVYAANAGTFGTLSTSTGAFSSIGDFGEGGGTLGNIDLSDVDGLAVDPRTGIFWGTHRQGDGSAPEDVLFQINPVTGSHVPNVFGAGIDYVTIKTSVISPTIQDVDDIAIDPTTGIMYGVANGNGTNDHLVAINMTTGVIINKGQITAPGGGNLQDIEAFSFFNDGTFYISNGANNGGNPAPAMYTIDTSDASTTLVREFGIGGDYEGIGCLTAGSNIISGTIFEDFNADTIFNAGDVGQSGVEVILYIDENNDGMVDAGDTQIQTRTTDGNGEYEFEVAFLQNFVVATTLGSYPANATLVTNNIEEADFATFGNSDTGNDFGFAVAADVSIAKSVDLDSVTVGEDITFSIIVSNAGPAIATGVEVSDVLPAGLTYVSDNGGGAYVSGTGVWTVPNVAVSGSQSLTITATVSTVGSKTNTASITDTDLPDPTTNDYIDSAIVVGLLPDIAMAKVVDNATPEVGENIVFTITATNVGLGDATGVTATDVLPSEFTYVSDDGGGSYIPGTGIWTIGNLATTASASLNITATANKVGTPTNTVTLTTIDQTDPNSSNDSASVPVTIDCTEIKSSFTITKN